MTYNMHYHDLKPFVEALCELGSEVDKSDECFIIIRLDQQVVLEAKRASDKDNFWSVEIDSRLL